MLGARVKISWEGQLVDPQIDSIYYYIMAYNYGWMLTINGIQT